MSLSCSTVTVNCQTCLDPSKDFQQVIKWSDMLLSHYTVQWRDRQTYWMARQRAASYKDLCCLIIDGYDKGKICLPKWPKSRLPKKVIYETVQRSLPAPMMKQSGIAS